MKHLLFWAATSLVFLSCEKESWIEKPNEPNILEVTNSFGPTGAKKPSCHQKGCPVTGQGCLDKTIIIRPPKVAVLNEAISEGSSSINSFFQDPNNYEPIWDDMPALDYDLFEFLTENENVTIVYETVSQIRDVYYIGLQDVDKDDEETVLYMLVLNIQDEE